MLVSGSTYRYFFSGHLSGALTITFVDGSWRNVEGTAFATASHAGAATAESNLTEAAILPRTWFGVRLTPTAGAQVDVTSLGANDLTFSGGGTQALIFSSVQYAGGLAIYSYTLPGALTAGTVTVTFNAGAWHDTDGNLSAGGSSSFRTIVQGTSFYIELSGGIMLQAGDFLDEPLLHIRASVVLEIDYTRLLFILTFAGQIDVYGLGTLGAASGRFVLLVGDETTNPMHPVPQFWGVATVETNFEALEQFGIHLDGSAQLRINLTNEVKTEIITLPGVGPGGSDLTETFVLQPFSFGFQILGQLVVAPGGTELLRVQGGLYLNISANPPTPSMDVFLTGTLSFGSGAARLEYGSVTGVLMISTRTDNGAIPGVAGSIRVAKGVNIGLPDIGSLFSATGSVNIIFNTTLADQTFVVPNAFLPLLLPGQSPVFYIPKSPPGIDGQPDPTAPPGGAIYVVASIQAELTIGGAFTLTGFVGITAAIDPNGTAYLKVDGMVGTTIPYLGSLTGALNLAVYVGAQTGVVGRVQLTLGVNSIPGLSLNGQFLLEINTFAGARQIRTFVVESQTVNGVTVFGGFQRQNGQLVVANQTINVVSGFRLEMYGSLKVMNVLDINGHLVLTVGANELSLLVNGSASLNVFGSVVLRDSGFRINSKGLVARLDLSLGAGFGGSVGLGFSVSAVLAINTTGANATFGSSTVLPGFLLRLDGAIDFLGFARGSGYAEIRIASSAFEMKFGVAFDLAGLKFNANGVAGIYSDGFVMAVAVSASADAFVFSLSASGMLRINTTGEVRNGVERGFKLQLTGSVTLLKLFSFNAGFTIEVGKTSATDSSFAAGDWYLDAYAGLSFFGFGLSGSIFLNSDGNFSLTLSGRMQLGGSFMGIRGDFHLEISFLTHEQDGIVWYTLFIGGGASVEVYFDFKLFEISLGVGLDLSVSADSRNADSNGDVPLRFRITVRFKVLGSWYSRSDTFTIGSVRFPVVPYLAGNGNTYTGGDSFKSLREWRSTDRDLWVNVGGSAQRTARAVSTGVINETVRIEQIGSLSGGLATIRITAFGHTRTYANVQRIHAYFGDGVDNLVIDPSVQIPVTIDGGSGNDTILVQGSGSGISVSGGSDNDTITVSGSASGTVNGGDGNDTLRHTGTGALSLFGDDGNDTLIGSTIADVLSGGDGNDTLSGPARRYEGGAGDDVITTTAAVFTSPDTEVVTGGTGTDRLILVLTGGSDLLTISNPSTGVLAHLLGGATRTSSGIENLVIDAGAGADQLTLSDITGAGSGLQTVEILVGAGSTDIVTILGSNSAADTFTISTDGLRTRVVRSTGNAYTVWIDGAVRGQGDSLVVDGRAGADTIDASAVSADRLALTLIGGTDDDRLIGSPFADVLDSGTGDDTVTGGLGLDAFLDAGGSDTLVESFASGDFGLYRNLFVHGLAVGTDFGTGSIAEDLQGIFETARLTSTGTGATTILIGDADGTVLVAGVARAADPWTGTAYVDPGAGDDLVRVELTRSQGMTVHVIGSAGSDRLEIWGSTAPDDLIVDTVASPPAGTQGSRVRRVSFSDSGVMTTLGTITHGGVELVEIRTLAGGDRIAVRAITVQHRLFTGEHTDRIAVGSQAAGAGTTNTAWTNSGGTVNAIGAPLAIVGGSGPGVLTGADLLSVDDSGDASPNTGALTSNTITGLGMSSGITYSELEHLTIDLGTGGDTFTVHSTHGGTTTITAGAGADTVIVRTVSGITSIDTGSGADTVRVSSTLTGIGGVLTGIAAPLSLSGGDGVDLLFLDDAAAVLDRLGVLTATFLAGLGMTGGSPTPSLVQVVTVRGAVNGRFTLTVAGIGTTAQLAFDATAAQVKAALAALVGAANLVVTKAGTRWIIAWTGALAGSAGATRILTLGTVAGHPLVAGAGGSVTTEVLRMTDGRVDYATFESLDLALGSGSDVLNVDSTHSGTTTVHGGAGHDRVFVEALGGATTILGDAGDDWLLVNAAPGPVGVNPMAGQALTLSGGANSDYFVIDLFGLGSSRINTTDVIDGGTNVLVVNGSAAGDTFLFRRNATRSLIAQLSAPASVSGQFGAAEKVTYGQEMTGGVIVNGLAGDDTFAFDDTGSVLTVNGDSGNDRFRFGQLYRSYLADSEFPASAFFASTRGLLTRGVSFTASVRGGSGDDLFEVFRNVATLNLYGDAGDDTFVIRSFAGESELTALNAGEGRNFIEYASNAPVNIDGGAGYDLVVIIGTEFGDTFVITASGVYGAGRVIRYVNVERVSIYGMAGDDVFHVLSTNPAVELAIFGGRGSDRVEVGSTAPAVQAGDLLGHTGLVRHSVESTVANSAWALLRVDGIATEIMDDEEPTIVLAPLGGSLTLTEGGSTRTLAIRLTKAPTTTVQVTLVAPAVDPESTSRSRAIELSVDGGATWQTSVTLVFAAGDTAQRSVLVRAVNDLAAEGEWFSPIDVIATGGEYAGALVATTFARVIDDDAPEVPVVIPDGGIRVIEAAGGSGGTTASYEVRISSTPRGPVTVLLTAPTGLLISADGVSWTATLTLTFTAAGTRIVQVRAVDDTAVEGQHVQAITAVVTSVDRVTGTVSAVGGLSNEIVFTGITVGADALKGHLIRITSGPGAGQIRRIWSNTATRIEIEGEWDVAPGAGATFVVTGYTAPITTNELVGTVTAVSGDNRTVTLSGVALPTTGGGLAGALLRLVDANGTATYRTIASNTANTITVVDPWGAGTFVLGTSRVYVAEVPGAVVDRVSVLVHDGDSAGVVITPVGGDIRLVEGATGSQVGASATYTVRLTRAPAAGETVTVRLDAIASFTLDIGGPDCGLPNGCRARQLEFWNGSAWVSALALTFTAANWSAERTVTIRAVDDTRIDGDDVQEFADSARRLHLIQGPLYVSGGDDPNPPVQLELDDYLPILLPGESSAGPLPVTGSSAGAIETAQVDTLVLHNEDSPADDTGVLTRDRVTGLGMAGDYSLAGRPVLGGIRYAQFEELTILLGYGDDVFTVQSTHAGTTTIHAGPGDDRLTIRTIDGHTQVIGGPTSPSAPLYGNTDDDTFHVGTVSGILDLLAALLVLEGGVGRDVANLDDSGDTGGNLGWLTPDALTGLDMEPRTGLDELGRPIDKLYAVTPRGGSFTIMLSQVRGGVATGIGAVTFAAGTSAETVRAALQSLLFPTTPGADPGVSMSCGEADTTRCAASVYVWLVGGTYFIGFRGEVNADTGQPITIALSALGASATDAATDGSATSGIRYHGLEVLNLALGSGSDVLNVRGTLPVTNISFGAGDDRVYISSRADVGLTEKPQFLAGDLDLIHGTLNLDLGTGRHTLLLSDEGASAGDPAVVITDRPALAGGLDADLAADGEIFVVGLAPAGISWRAAASGTFADGIRIWTSGLADGITIDGTHQRAGVRTTTWLNTGLGSDTITVDLKAGQDGFFVLHTQGPNDNVLGLGVDLDDGDQPVRPDVVLEVRVNGVLVPAVRYVSSTILDSVGLFDSLVPGDVVTVTLRLTAWSVQSTGSFDLGATGDLVGFRVWVNGRLLEASEITRTGSLLAFAAPAQRDGSTAHVVVEVTRTRTETFTMPASGAILPAGTTDDDVVNGHASTLPLVVFGGIGADRLHGGNGGDIIFGDRGIVEWVDATGAVVARSGNGGEGDFTDGTPSPLGRVRTIDPTIGGADVITTGVGADIVLGGAGGDTITTNHGETAGTPDRTGIVFGDHGLIDWVAQDADPSDIDRVWSLDPVFGGSDVITTGTADDLVIGGTGGDTIAASDGRNVVLGDNGRFTATSGAAATPAWGALALTAGRLETTDPGIGGADTVNTGAGIDLVLGGAAGDTIATGAAADIVLGDHGLLDLAVRAGALHVVTITVTDRTIGGDDTIRGEAGQDLLVGGVGDDRIDGGADNDLVFGDNVSLDRSATFGNHTNPRFRVLTGTAIYSVALGTAGNALVTVTWQNSPAGATAWSDFRITLLDHAADTAAGRFGNDYLAGGAHDDTIFGQLGADVIQGDGSIDLTVGASRPEGDLVLLPSAEAASDGDDYLEGGGGVDVVFGNLGRDDIIGGSSSLFSLDAKNLRPDAKDFLFGGAGTDVGRNDDTALHGRDSDTIVGDNGNILRLVGTNGGAGGGYLAFTYDNYGESVRLLPRAVTLLDYTPGGPDFAPASLTGDVWGADEIHGESGDDTVYGGGGSDVVFGDAGDDDLIGGWGHDWISGGTGIDGILGDDGRIFTSRNGQTEVLNGVTTASVQVEITTPGRVQVAILFPTGKLTKRVDLTPFAVNGQHTDTLYRALHANDVLFGGWDGDFLHGGSGDDAISGAEARPVAYGVGGVRSDFARPFNDGTLLGFDTATGEFALYDEYFPMRRIVVAGGEWFLNFGHTEGRLDAVATTTRTDGDDVLFGDHGNDWMVGGTGRDTLWGGWGNDLLNADDVLTTAGGENTSPDTNVSYEDRAYGGAGLDVLIANTGGDRLIDWAGEFNSYLVPFAPFGMGTVSRQLAPGLHDFLYQLSRAQGADATIAQESGDMSLPRNGEPFGEIGLVTQKDDAWQDQTGGPRDPQPGNVPGGKRDVLRSAAFSTGTTEEFFADSGVFAVQSGTLTVTATGTGGDAAAVYYIDQYLPIYFEIHAQVYLTKPTGGWKANAFVIFDYFSPTDFKFAGVDQSTNKLVMGRRTASGWQVDVQASVPGGVKYNTWYTMMVAVNGTTVTVLLDGTAAFTHTFAPRVLDGVTVALNKGFVGMGSNGARGQFDNISVQVLPPTITLDTTDEFTGPGTVGGVRGTWTTASGALTGAAAGAPAIALANLNAAIAANAYLELTTIVSLTAGSRAGIVYDYYSATDYKFIVLDQAAQAVLFGHVAGTQTVIDDRVARTITAGVAYTLQVTIKGASVSLTVNGAFVLSRAYNAALADGRFGLLVPAGSARFESLRIRTDGYSPPPATITSLAAPPASTGPTSTTTTSTTTTSTPTTTTTTSTGSTTPTSTGSTTPTSTTTNTTTATGSTKPGKGKA